MDFNLQSIQSQLQQLTSAFPIIGDALAGAKEKMKEYLSKISSFQDSSDESGLIVVNDELVPIKDVIHAAYLNQIDLEDDQNKSLFNYNFINSLTNKEVNMQDCLNELRTEYQRSDVLQEILVNFDPLRPSESIKALISDKMSIVSNDEVLHSLKTIDDQNYPEVLGGIFDLISADPQFDQQTYSVKGKTGVGLGLFLLQLKVPAFIQNGINIALQAIVALGYGILTVVGFAAKCLIEFIPNIIRLVKGYGPIAKGNNNVSGISPIPLMDIFINDTITFGQTFESKYGCAQDWLLRKFYNKTVITKIGPMYAKVSLVEYVDQVIGHVHKYSLKWRFIAYGSPHGILSLSGINKRGLLINDLNRDAWYTTSIHPSTSDFDFYYTQPTANNSRYYSLIPMEVALACEIKMVHNVYPDVDYTFTTNIDTVEHMCNDHTNWLYRNLGYASGVSSVSNNISLGTVSAHVFDQYVTSPLKFILGNSVSENLDNYLTFYYGDPVQYSSDNYLLGTEMLYKSLSSIDDAWNLISLYYWNCVSDKTPLTASGRFCQVNGNNVKFKLLAGYDFNWVGEDWEWLVPLHSTDQFSYYGTDLHNTTDNVYHSAYAPSGLIVDDLTYVGDHRTSMIFPYLQENTVSQADMSRAVGTSTWVPLINYDDQSISKHWILAYGNQGQEGSINSNSTIASTFINFEYTIDSNTNWYPFGHAHRNFINFITHHLFLKDTIIHPDFIVEQLGLRVTYPDNVTYFDLPELASLPGLAYNYVSDVERGLRTAMNVVVGGLQIGTVLATTAGIFIKRWAYQKRIQNENKRWTVIGKYDPKHPEGYVDKDGEVHPSKKEFLSTMKKANFSDKILSIFGGKGAYGEPLDDSSDDGDGFTIGDVITLIQG